MTHEEQAQAFMQAASQHQEKLTRYAWKFTQDNDEAYNLYMSSMLKCYDCILKRGVHDSLLLYLISAIKLNFFYTRRGAVSMVLLSTMPGLELQEEDKTDALISCCQFP